MAEIKLSLLQNANSFVCEALAKAALAEKYSSQWKFAILNLVQAIELSLKELLRDQHAILIYKNVDSPDKTVSLEQALGRLLKISKIQFEQDDLSAIRTASDYRNQIVHYEFAFKESDLKLVFAKLLGFLQHYYTTHLETPLDIVLPKKLWKEAINITEYAGELFKRAEAKFKKDSIDEENIWTCRGCGWKAFVIHDDINTCFVCGKSEDVRPCDHCGELFYWDDLRDFGVGRKEFCESCRDYLSDDYWYEQMAGK